GAGCGATAAEGRLGLLAGGPVPVLPTVVPAAAAGVAHPPPARDRARPPARPGAARLPGRAPGRPRPAHQLRGPEETTRPRAPWHPERLPQRQGRFRRRRRARRRPGTALAGPPARVARRPGGRPGPPAGT